MSIRVHKLAKDLGLTSKELIEKLHKLKIKAKGHMSSLDDDTATLVKEELTASVKTRKTKEKTVAPKEKKTVSTKEKPVVVAVPCAAPEPAEEKAPEPSLELKVLKIDIPITVKELAVKLQTKPNELIKRLLSKKILITINQSLGEETAGPIAEDFGYKIERLPTQEEALLQDHQEEVDPKKLKPRAPIVTLMGH
ncbi:MAG: translation initiation factor IF-2 N-terminal domain-containing protein, partial [Candidatus Omnitrophica bacterium]|nr:translation initiation factor IF-2 N-terminal domain-containing protein [Candidatus Omnitrophota bacterium]